MRRQALSLGIALVALTVWTGCPVEPPVEEVYLWQTSGAPPSLTAKLDNSEIEARTIHISRGAVMAVRCWETDENDCENLELDVDPPELIQVHEVYVLGGYVQNAYALVGGSKGSGVLTVRTPKAVAYYTVFVEEPPR